MSALSYFKITRRTFLEASAAATLLELSSVQGITFGAPQIVRLRFPPSRRAAGGLEGFYHGHRNVSPLVESR